MVNTPSKRTTRQRVRGERGKKEQSSCAGEEEKGKCERRRESVKRP
jgi:hypothetical protein